MLRFLLRRLFSLLVVLLGVSLVIFVLMDIIPGDPVAIRMGQRADPELREIIRRELNLDKPLLVRYGIFLGKLARGDLGRSYDKNLPVTEVLWDKFLNTLYLTLAAMLIAVGVGMALGVVASLKPNSPLDLGLMVLAVIGLSVPVFWLGMMLQLIFSGKLPISGMGEFGRPWWENLDHLVLPAVTLATVPMAVIARITRSSMLEVWQEEFVRTAVAKGLPPVRIVLRHVLRNALIPIVTVIGNNFALLLTGAVLTETVFSWPGVGSAMVQAIERRDIPLVIGGVMMLSATFVVVNFLVDLLYALIDPRVRVSEEGVG